MSNEDKENWIDNFSKFFEQINDAMAKIIREKIENGEFDPNSLQTGFKIEMGPDGPLFSPISDFTYDEIQPEKWRKPFTDVFIVENGSKYHIICEMPGVETEHIKLNVKENKLMIQAENYEFRYRKGLMMKQNLNPNALNYIVRNGVLEIFIETLNN